MDYAVNKNCNSPIAILCPSPELLWFPKGKMTVRAVKDANVVPNNPPPSTSWELKRKVMQTRGPA